MKDVEFSKGKRMREFKDVDKVGAENVAVIVKAIRKLHRGQDHTH